MAKRVLKKSIWKRWSKPCSLPNREIRYQVAGYNSIWYTRNFRSIKAMLLGFSYDRGVFKVFDKKAATKKDFVFIEYV